MPETPAVTQRGPVAKQRDARAARGGQETPKVRTREEAARRERTDQAAKSRQDNNAQQRQVQNRARREAEGAQPGGPAGANGNKNMQREKARTQSGERP
jgi:hypothetical protein